MENHTEMMAVPLRRWSSYGVIPPELSEQKTSLDALSEMTLIKKFAFMLKVHVPRIETLKFIQNDIGHFLKTKIVLVGITGTGKSSLVNTIFGKEGKSAEDDFGVRSVSNSSQRAEAKTVRRSLSLIDIPGFDEAVFDYEDVQNGISTGTRIDANARSTVRENDARFCASLMFQELEADARVEAEFEEDGVKFGHKEVPDNPPTELRIEDEQEITQEKQREEEEIKTKGLTRLQQQFEKKEEEMMGKYHHEIQSQLGKTR